MKRLVFLLVFLLIPIVSFASSIDGIWGANNLPGGLQVYEDNGFLVVTFLKLNDSWEAYAGTWDGVTGRLFGTPYSYVNIDMTFTVTSQTTGTVRINSCSPKSTGYCFFPAGTILQVYKMY